MIEGLQSYLASCIWPSPSGSSGAVRAKRQNLEEARVHLFSLNPQSFRTDILIWTGINTGMWLWVLSTLCPALFVRFRTPVLMVHDLLVALVILPLSSQHMDMKSPLVRLFQALTAPFNLCVLFPIESARVQLLRLTLVSCAVLLRYHPWSTLAASDIFLQLVVGCVAPMMLHLYLRSPSPRSPPRSEKKGDAAAR